MRIAFINSVAGYGSTGKLVEMLGEGLESRIYYGRKSAAADLNGLKAEEKRDEHHFYFGSTVSFASHIISTFLIDNHGFASTAETEKMIEDLKAFQPDLVHLHNLHGYYLNVRPLFHYLKDSGVKVIWTLHDCWAFTGHCAHYSSVHCEKWKEGCYDCPALSHYPPTWNGRNIRRNYRNKKSLFTSLNEDQLLIVTPSKWLKGEVEQSFLGKYEVRTIPNGINLSLFARRTSKVREKYSIGDKFMILAVAGVWYPEKGTEDLIQIAKVMHRDSVLAVVGASGSFAKQLDRENVITIKRTENIEELAELYSAADVLVNPTKEDTFPTVNIEAQACGCPVVTYNTGGSPEILTAKTGIAVEAENVNQLLSALASIRTKEVVFQPEDCIENAKQYSRENMLEAYRSLYREVMEI